MRSKRLVPVLVSALAAIGTLAGVMVATAGGRPSDADGRYPGIPSTRPAPAKSASPVVPLLAGRGLAGGAPAAYVCREFTCRAPVTAPEQLREALAGSG